MAHDYPAGPVHTQRRAGPATGGRQTDSDLKVKGAFEREGDAAASDTEAAKAIGAELA